MNNLFLPGCTPTPLMSYLKALGIFRLVAEHPDPDARASWEAEQLVLETKLSREELSDFFLREYCPSPILAPWNGGSGFHPGDNDRALRALEATEAKRFAPLRRSINGARAALAKLGIRAKPDGETKQNLIETLRNELPDEALQWLDAVAVILGDQELKFPPLIGTGGNDGRLEFTNNFLQRLTELFSADDGSPKHEAIAALEESLFATPAPVCTSAPVGQFSPGSAGGANNTSGFSGGSAINAWDFVFMLEGTLLFAASCSRRFDQQHAAARAFAYPFSVRATGAGYTADSLEEAKQSRAEIWLPTWQEPFDLRQLQALFNEGRAQISGRPARSGMEFALALGNFGVDRGLDTFYRYSFMVRNGLAYFAVATDRFRVRRNPRVPLILEVREWLDRLERAANNTKPPPPNSIPPMLLSLERAIMQQAHQPEDAQRFQDILLALGDAERQLNKTLRWSRDTAKVPPIAALSQRWRREAQTDAPEYRLAASLASSYLHKGSQSGHAYLPFRHFLEQVAVPEKETRGRVKWLEHIGRDAVWSTGSVIDSMIKIMQRLLVIHSREARSHWSLTSSLPAKLDDVEYFLSEDFNFDYFERCLWGLILLRWREFSPREGNLENRLQSYRLPPAYYSLLKLCFAGHPVNKVEVPLRPDVFHLAAAGDSHRASEAAIVRLRGSNLAPVLGHGLEASTEEIRRAAAALLFPIEPYSTERLGAQLLNSSDEEIEETSKEPVSNQ